MKRFTQFAVFMAAIFAMFALAAPASAQATRTWVSGVGDDVNPCSRTAPCKTFPGAIVKTAAGGAIDCLDPGGFGAVTVTKSITIECGTGTGEGGILVAGTNGVTVNCSNDPNCIVILEGLQIDGGPPGSNSLSGVKFIAGGTLKIEDCLIHNFTGGSPNGYGVWFNPVGAGTMKSLIIRNCEIMANGNGSGGSATGGGVYINPTGTGPISALIDHSTIVANPATAVFADTSSMTSGAVGVTISNSALSSNNVGVTTKTAGAATLNVAVMSDEITGNGSFGILTAGGNLKVGSSVISGNTTSVLQAVGSLLSYGNNEIDGNGTNTLPGTTALH